MFVKKNFQSRDLKFGRGKSYSWKFFAIHFMFLYCIWNLQVVCFFSYIYIYIYIYKLAKCQHIIEDKKFRKFTVHPYLIHFLTFLVSAYVWYILATTLNIPIIRFLIYGFLLESSSNVTWGEEDYRATNKIVFSIYFMFFNRSLNFTVFFSYICLKKMFLP